MSLHLSLFTVKRMFILFRLLCSELLNRLLCEFVSVDQSERLTISINIDFYILVVRVIFLCPFLSFFFFFCFVFVIFICLSVFSWFSFVCLSLICCCFALCVCVCMFVRYIIQLTLLEPITWHTFIFIYRICKACACPSESSFAYIKFEKVSLPE